MTATISLSNGAALLDLYPQLNALGQVPAFIQAIEDDHWLSAVGPWLRIADVVQEEDKHWRRLVEAIPDLEKFDLSVPPGDNSDSVLYRRKTRRAAVRAIAISSGLGSQTFSNHPLFAGDASLKVVPISGLVCRIGRVSSTSWKPTPTLLNRALNALSDLGTIRTVEHATFPIVASGQDYEKSFAFWKSLSKLREWDEQHRLPLVGIRAAMKITPSGYIDRYTKEDIEPFGVPFFVAAKIISPYAASVVREVRSALAAVVPASAELLLWATNRCGD